MNYAVGSLVKARGREWVVLPESGEELLVLRPLGGAENEISGVHLPLEPVEPARFALPDPRRPGDYYSCNLLRDAVRLGFRSSAGPFRSFGRIAVDPRPYQLVPLLMALKQDPVRILIADDVGVGKTVEAGLIARELLDRAEIRRMAVLCPPPLAEQWRAELKNKFHIDAELVLSSTVTRLERRCRVGQSLFDHYPHVVVSTDFIKSDRRRHEFLRTCPGLVIVDEAHTCANAGEGKGIRHQRHRLLQGLSENPDRHLILVTATPHAGKEAAFRSLLALLKTEFARLPEDLTGKKSEKHRRQLAAHFIQRKRGNIKSYLGSETVFPAREEQEEGYKLSPEYKKVFQRAAAYARESITSEEGEIIRRRIRWWSAMALLRAMASSPAAAAATLRNRAAAAEGDAVERVDELGRRTVLDLLVDEASESIDVTPGCKIELDEEDDAGKKERERLLRLARDVEKLKGKADKKLARGVRIVKEFLKDGYQPIVFCRFVHTAEYVAEALRKKLPKHTEVMAVTGMLPPKERVDRVRELSRAERRVLVCTDCLSEGINLQESFNAVLHYDLSWNPTRHEQREGRVDRYGQPEPRTRVVTFYGVDNQIDGVVLDVLIRKHKKIRGSLGVSVPAPMDADLVVEAIFEGLLLKKSPGEADQLLLPGFDVDQVKEKRALYKTWDAAVDREKRSRAMFAQRTIRVDEVVRELAAVQEAVGAGVDVARFVRETLGAHGAIIHENDAMSVDLTDPEVPAAIIEAAGNREKFKARFTLPVMKNEIHLNRTHPIVERMAAHVMESAFDPAALPAARRSGVILTRRVKRRATLLLMRFRHHIVTKTKAGEKALLAEDCRVLGFSGAPSSARWLDPTTLEELIRARPDANISPDRAIHFLTRLMEEFDHLTPGLTEAARSNGAQLLAAHQRVRQAAKTRGVRQTVTPHLPPDVLGAYIYLPAGDA
ncbi:MAG: DEAD/DEAH box helicase [Desulfobacterales bacterium]|nr:DEAD/DEAH box helicase [Desulfobacterales bacterium]